jgi:hypothetical protein
MTGGHFGGDLGFWEVRKLRAGYLGKKKPEVRSRKARRPLPMTPGF